MKTKTPYIFIGLLSFLFCFSNCNEDPIDEPEQITEISCCEIPHLEACVGGTSLYVPNAFSPNGDGFNDIFYPYGGQGIKEIVSFKITTQEDVLIYESKNFLPSNPVYGWDGKQADETIVDGVFKYAITLTNIADENFDLNGYVCCRSTLSPLPCIDYEKHCAYGSQHDNNGGFDPNLDSGEDCE